MLRETFNFTKDVITKIQPPKIKRDTYKDTKEAGLILIVSYGGSKVFYLGKRIQNKYHRFKLGNFPDLSIANAREKALELKTQIAKGFNPAKAITESPKEMTFKEIFDKYMDDYGRHSIKRWKYVINDVNRRAMHLYNKKLSAITRQDIQKIFNDITAEGKKVAANKFVGRMSSIFKMAIKWELVEKNPAVDITTHKAESRDRYLMTNEIPAFFKVLENETNEQTRDYILISLYTGARKSNVLAMRWDNINFHDKTWYLRNEITKNRQSQHVHLDEEVIKILKRRQEQNSTPWVFPSSLSKTGHYVEPRKGWCTLRKKTGLEDFRLHDLRRTLGSWMAHSGESTYVIGKALNHKSPSSTAIYARLSIDPVRVGVRKALDAIERIKNGQNSVKAVSNS